MRVDSDWEWEQLLLQLYEHKHSGIDLTLTKNAQGVSQERYDAAERDWSAINHVWSLNAIAARETRRTCAS